ncbi:coiled-coil domain-containing protein 22 homolog [Zingiber officinale]|uniref:Coiled-coil domain-containing protein 22 n=1 Tax=Zingiber officinale TaxID=94328 RepID=A0A8J5HCB9_ZINOF|nr:coiled-coil domain-containing protein 22 homolog [Zingiber officinale]KAG6520855.1 hypothetical protein ZIOFF_017916 [Zingiber officinale]
MDEAEAILLSSLRSSAVLLPPDFSTSSALQDLSPDALVSICVQSLQLIIGATASSLPTSLPDSAAERFKVCEDISAAIKSAGYIDEISFRQFLYPSKDESHKLLRFLVERLPESSQNRDALDDIATRRSNQGLTETIGISDNEVKSHELADNELINGHLKCDKVENYCKDEEVKDDSKESRKPEEVCDSDAESRWKDVKFNLELEQALSSLQLEKTKVGTQSKSFEVHNLGAQHELLKEATKISFDDQHSVRSCSKEHNEQAETRSGTLEDLKMRRNTLEATTEKTHSIEQELAEQPAAQYRLLKLKEIEQETEDTLLEIHRREIEHAELLAELDKLPSNFPRKYYIDRVTELTKTNRKQNTDILQISKDIREVQLDSNSAQERLHRTYAVVEETVFRNTKDDPAGRQLYRLLTSIHDVFEQIREKILATDRARREAAEHEKKLAAISSRTLDFDKLQADLDSIKKENESLEQQLRDA